MFRDQLRNEGTLGLVIAVSILTVLCLLLTCISLYFILSKNRKIIIKKTKREAKKIVIDMIYEAKAESAMLKNAVESEIKIKKQEIDNEIILLEEKRKKYLKDLDDFQFKQEKLYEEKNANTKLKNKLKIDIDLAIEALEKISEMTVEEAKEKLISFVEVAYIEELSVDLKNKEEKLKLKSAQVAEQILINAMEKCNVEIANSWNDTVFKFEDESLKGKIIGKEGKNIKAFQHYGGVDIVVDETPNRVLITSFNPIRRKIAYNALTTLAHSGKLQPLLIEETLIKEQIKIEEKFHQIGVDTLSELEIFDFPEELNKYIGKLYFRHSFGQNILTHSLEVAKLSRSIAEDLNLDGKLALKCGLLHDIGKSIDFETEGSHIKLGASLVKNLQLNPIIINAVESHHGDVEKNSVYAAIVSIADSISATRPGARSQNINDFITRMKEIEDECIKFKGVLNAYALQSGRQIRVIVNPEVISDYEMKKLIFDIKQKIKQINKTPGEIVITLIREKKEYEKI